MPVKLRLTPSRSSSEPMFISNGSDLQGIRIPGADLTGGQFDSALLQDSVLTGVKLTKARIRQVDFSRAQMEGTQFGEMRYLEEDDRIFSCAFSPDQKSFAVGLKKGDITIYDTSSWTKVRTFQGHEGWVKDLAYSPNSQQLLSGSYDHTMRLWDCETGSTDFVLGGHAGFVRAVAFSPSGKQVASASDDCTVRLWDTKTGAVAFVLPDHTEVVRAVSYSPDGDTIVTCGDDGTIQVFSTQTGQVLLSTVALDVEYRCSAYSSDGQLIVTGDGNGNLQVWEAATLFPRLRLNSNSSYVYCVKFSPTGQEIVSCSDSTLRVWDGNTGALISTLRGQLHPVTSVVFSPDGLKIASASSWETTVSLWEVNPTVAGLGIESSFDHWTCAACSPDGQVFISGGSSGNIQYFDADTGKPSFVIRRNSPPIMCIAYSPSGLQIAV
ncbi:hypothetical protein BGZ96_012589, partial [Linnemannia gamsii]